MPELEIHHENESASDPTGKKVGVLAALLAVALAIVTIASHRTHTAAIMHKSGANDAWAHYQATRLKFHNLELGESLVKVFGAKNEQAGRMLADYAAEKTRYAAQSDQIQREAESADKAAEADEHRALRYDIGEGLLEIGLVLSSLYFIARRMMFPLAGGLAGALGAAVAVTGLMV